MPKYCCSYAYDVPHYLDFTVEAKNKKEAERLIKAALAAGDFTKHDDVMEANYENQCNERVFVSDRANEQFDHFLPTLADLQKAEAE